MTSRLREALRDTAEDAPVYPVYERALATARRTRRRNRGAAALVLALVALAVTVAPVGRAPSVDPADGVAGVLPDRIGLPPIGALHVTDRPRLGPAAVLFSGERGRLNGPDPTGYVGAVGADSDRYRILRMGAHSPAGEKVLLSPDGRYIARSADDPERPGVDVIDLVTGRTRHVESTSEHVTFAYPAGWAPDGRHIAMVDLVFVDAQRSSLRSVLSIVSVDGRERTRVREAAHQQIFAHPVAFTPAGDRLAYQVGNTVWVAARDGTRLSSFALPYESTLAGKGAWTPDGRWLTLATRRVDSSEWHLRRVDPLTGRDAAALDLPAVSDVTTIRLLGWGPDGSALVAGFIPNPLSPARFDQPLEIDQRTSSGSVRGVRVLALTPGAAEPRTVLTAPDQILAIDVADGVIESGRVREASPPGGVGGRFWWWTGLIILVWGGIAAYRGRVGLALWFDDRRVRRARAAASRK
ncbi:TolB family protein [Micromonospora sp. NPDC049903]|uniref:TolB family protein n=1 Tax=Micromonospora sp. NPDC049903 TaxID=3364276 RepID=UPI0037A88A28